MRSREHDQVCNSSAATYPQILVVAQSTRDCAAESKSCTGSTQCSGSCMSNALQSSDNKRFPILMCRLTAGFDEALLVFGKDTSQKHAEVIREIKAGKSPGCLVGGGTPLLQTRSQKRTLETSGSQILKSSFFCLLVICIQNDVKMVCTSTRLPFLFFQLNMIASCIT